MSRPSRKVPIESNDGFHPLNTLRTEVEHVFGRLAAGAEKDVRRIEIAPR